MKNRILEGLNNKQIEAVRAINGPVLVISGPGSGKTKCLTHRIAYLISQNIHPANILAVTFTNKAAREMKDRILNLLELSSVSQPIIGTFHSICLRILRREIALLGYKSNFNIFDSDDQLTLIRTVMKDLDIDPKRFNPKAIRSKISSLKTELVEPDKYAPSDFYSKLVAKVYDRYQSELKKANGLDFDDLIGLTIKIFYTYPEVLDKYHNKWRYILVDEYQDTSHDQYILIKLLAKKNKNLFCIGDDAQSIYQFRQADIRNILNFQKDYPEAKTILLEQNYRSTKNILAVAQNVIANNMGQIQKTLWTDNIAGEKICVLEALNERHEANYIISYVEDYLAKGYKMNNIAVLYRTHAQSRAIEESLVIRGFPYQIVGGIKFYERKEIKDILAYLRLLNNPADLISFERIANIPVRGIGKGTLNKIREIESNSPIEAVKMLAKDMSSKKQGASLASFYKNLKELEALKSSPKLSGLIKSLVSKIKYESYLKEFSLARTGGMDNFEERLENIKELITVAKKYDSITPGGDALNLLLEEISLLQESDPENTKSKSKTNPEKITLMTAHASKGLEFPIVFMPGLEEGLFPHSRSLLDLNELEEERRLCYVAITRAKEHLIISYAQYRNIFGMAETNLPSRFLGEMPQDMLNYKLGNYLDDFKNDGVVEY